MSKQFPEYITLAEGGRVTVQLEQGVTIGGAHLTVAHVRQLNAGDIMDAQEEAERLVYTSDGGMALVMSPARMARASLRRQVARLAGQDHDKIVEHHGPLSADELNKFSISDFARVQSAADLLDKTVGLTPEKQAGATEARGRSLAGSGEHTPAAGAGSPQGGN